ncbi:MAG: hydroxymethylglutaryl-CoA lyase [Planctomycetes bacterium]|nr:hydroxymethylglutaryl-CoA lyase [Planctomycetota bacterium]
MGELPTAVRIQEVGPRDGLQNEPRPVPTDVKVAFVERLAAAGLTEIEATSFVRPDRVPQLADATELAARLPALPAVTISALVPNAFGLRRAIEAGIERIAVFTAASDTFARHNINMSVDESLEVYAPVVRDALAGGLSVRGYVSTCFVCPYEGEVSRERVREVTERLLEMGVDEVAISDTIGAAVPRDVFDTVGLVLERVPAERLALHLHDTYGLALANVHAGLELGITCFDSAAGGFGGCPYAPGAAGNVATEDLVYLLDRLGIETGVDLEQVVAAAELIAGALGKEPPSRQFRRIKALCGRTADDR